MADRPYGIPVTDYEWRLVCAAAAMMADWQRHGTRAPFRQVLVTRAEGHLLAHGLSREDYREFRLLVDAIRNGRGHPTDNLPPLIELLRTDSNRRIR
jgi:hypothetical protein